eukprot:scaffold25074_cov157-Cylindrotheca_fusiformis.AAC.2
MANRIKRDDKSTKQPSSVKSHWVQYWNSNRSSDRYSGRKISAVWAIRILLLVVMTTLCALLGFLAYKLLSDQQRRDARTQFESDISRAMKHAKRGLGFEEVTNLLLEKSKGEDMSFVVFVDPANMTQFDTFAKSFYQKFGLPNTTAIQAFDFGVWARDPTSGSAHRYHDAAADTPHGSPYAVLAPIVPVTEDYRPIFLLNDRSRTLTGKAIESILTCSQRRKEKYQDQMMAEKETLDGRYPTMPPNQCGAFTDIISTNKLGGGWVVGTFNPIYPRNDPLDVVGYIPALTPLDNLLENMFPPGVTGIHAVFETGERAITFKIVDGNAVLVGEGRIIDPQYEDQQRHVELAEPAEWFSTDDGSNVTATLVFSLVPNHDFYKNYNCTGPTIAAAVVVCSILVTMLVFCLYDYFVRREFNAKQELLEARRQFMRFVSHEVRTPLNAVSMGLDLMQAEVAQALGFDSPTTIRSSYVMIDDGAFESSERTSWSDADNAAVGKHAGNSSSETLSTKKNDSSSTMDSIGDIRISPILAKSWFQLIQEIQANAQGAVDILNDLLNYDKIEQGTLNLRLELLPIWELVEKAVMEFKVAASSKKVGLSVAFGEETRTTPRAQYLPTPIRNLKVVGDPVRLSQVVRNLMSNALKFTPGGGNIQVQAILIRSSTDASEEYIELEDGWLVAGYNRGSLRVRVVDTGAGMSKDQLDSLFQEGVQFNANELQAGGGSGLGLFIAKGIVVQHGGSLTASSEGLGYGTTFELSVPLWEIRSSSGNAESDVETGLPEAVQVSGVGSDTGTDSGTNQSMMLPKSKLRVLVVDDVKSNRRLLRRILENKGHECEEACDGQECVEMVRRACEQEHPFHSILLDYEMPEMDGPTAAKTIRKELMDTETNIVGVTGNVLPDDVQFFKKCGANEVLSKPVKIGELLALWERYSILLTNSTSTGEEVLSA